MLHLFMRAGWTSGWRAVGRVESAWRATAWYAVVAVMMSWPLVTGLSERLPLDLGDPLLNLWILAWDWDHLSAIARGDWAAWAGLWHATFFHPSPIVLAYSEHLFAQAVQGLPIYAATGSATLTYNLLFLSTFVLSGLGVYLLVRDLTASPAAAFLAGLFYAFSPYRLTQLGHLQVLSSQWMPFALVGLHRWFSRLSAEHHPTRLATPGGDEAASTELSAIPRRTWRAGLPLAGAAAAVVAQNLSCGYFLVFFAPFLVAYIGWEIARRGLWRQPRVWMWLAAGAAVVVAATVPFLLPYLELRAHGFEPRPLAEVSRFSADAFSYLRALDDSVWRWVLSDFTVAEGTLFQGFVPMGLAALGLVVGLWRGWRGGAGVPATTGWRRVVAAIALAVCIACAALAVGELFAGRSIRGLRELWRPMALIGNVLLAAGAALGVVLAVSPRARATVRWGVSIPAVFFVAAAVGAAWLSFGPVVATKGFRLTEHSAYAWLYHHVPGFDGLRVPARFAMLVALFLSIAAGHGVAALERLRRGRLVVLSLLGVVFLAEASSLPMPTSAIEWERRDGRPGTVREETLARLYTFVAAQPAGRVVLELPLGRPLDDTRALYFATLHRRPVVNGYSSGAPPHYGPLVAALSDPSGRPEEAWRALIRSGATLVVLHEWAFEGDRGRAVRSWLEQHGARLLGIFHSSRLYDLQGVRS